MQLHVCQPDWDCTPYFDKIIQKLNQRFEEMKRNNPRGYLDAFEARLELTAAEIALEMKAKFEIKDDTLIFKFNTH